MQESILKTSSPSSKKYAKVHDSRHKVQEKQGTGLRFQDAGIQAHKKTKRLKTQTFKFRMADITNTSGI